MLNLTSNNATKEIFNLFWSKLALKPYILHAGVHVRLSFVASEWIDLMLNKKGLHSLSAMFLTT